MTASAQVRRRPSVVTEVYRDRVAWLEAIVEQPQVPQGVFRVFGIG